jgi:hypothetical protein
MIERSGITTDRRGFLVQVVVHLKASG